MIDSGQLRIIVLAAGQSRRFASARHKCLHDLLGRPVLSRLLDTLHALSPAQVALVLGHQADQVKKLLVRGEDTTMQTEQLGTAHAMLCGLSAFAPEDTGFLLCAGDTPLLRPDTLQALVDRSLAQGADIGILSTEMPDPTGYGRVLHTKTGPLVIEEKDASAEQKQIREVNAGVYFFNMTAARLSEALQQIGQQNAQNEYYLPDILAMPGLKVIVHGCPQPSEIIGINRRADLAACVQALSGRSIEDLERGGVTFYDASTCLISPEVRIGQDTIIEPGCQILGATQIGKNCHIRAYSYLQDAQLADGCTVGPFAHLRQGSQLADGAGIGAFVETKNAQIGPESKVPHLSYIGDSRLGARVNIGAGTITANYDALRDQKYTTELGDDVKVGSNTVFVAPCQLADGCMTGAGSVITEGCKDPDSLLIARPEQKTKTGWVQKRRRQVQPE